jgi:hypothetical protein
MHLVLVVSDCPLPPEAGEGRLADAIPALPALSLLLARGNATPAPRCWQRRLIDALGRDRGSLAAVAAAAVPGADPETAWLATPVHLQAASDHLRLPSGGLLRLAADEAQALCSDFERVFGPELRLHPLVDGSLLLTGCAAVRGLPEPSRHLGERLAAATADGALRRLASEIELWLHDHAVNRSRDGRRLPRISALWLWGGERPAAGPPETSPLRLVRVHGADAVIHGMAAGLGMAMAPAPQRFGLLAGAARDETVLVQVSALAGADGLDALERDWFDPALQALRAGDLGVLTLMILDAAVESTRARSWKLWRSRAPWWETLRR